MKARKSCTTIWETVASRISLSTADLVYCFRAAAVGAAFGDIFHTGQIDIAINNLNDGPTLLRNQSPSPNAWLLVRLVGTRTNRAAIGSRVLVESEGRRQIQEVRSGGSFCSQSDLRLHRPGPRPRSNSRDGEMAGRRTGNR